MNADLISFDGADLADGGFLRVYPALLGRHDRWELYSPGGAPRHGVPGIDTTRGDRLFISLLGSAYILLLWLAIFGTPLWIAGAICVIFALAVFRWV